MWQYIKNKIEGAFEKLYLEEAWRLLADHKNIPPQGWERGSNVVKVYGKNSIQGTIEKLQCFSLESDNQVWMRWKSVNLMSTCKFNEDAEKEVNFLART